jgi:hypothetical protein
MEVLRIINTYLSMHAKDQFINFVLSYLQERKVFLYLFSLHFPPFLFFFFLLF